MKDLMYRTKLAYAVFRNRGATIIFNNGKETARLNLERLPTEGDTLQVGTLIAEFKQK
tara:strand:+ start:513 stop:686 length:174 start_codon:yes stop_codon:yes gene_type:complete